MNHYAYEGVHLCQPVFCYITDISAKQLDTCIKAVCENGSMIADCFQSDGKNLSLQQTNGVLAFLEDLAEREGFVCEGETPPRVLLPIQFTRGGVYRNYETWAAANSTYGITTMLSFQANNLSRIEKEDLVVHLNQDSLFAKLLWKVKINK